MEVLIPIIAEMVIKTLRDRCKDNLDEAAMRGTSDQAKWKLVRRKAKSAAVSVNGRRWWRANKTEYLRFVRAKMNDPVQQADVYAAVYDGDRR